ncbi:MAG: amine dehydrogenase, partial [Proteobacteria bacterium]|nr:amine dehydrogenase [Pseudomonadota bacterium]
VTVVDLVGRRILSEVEIPGCSMTYPLAQRSFATLCGDGTMLSITLDTDGKLARTQSSQAFNNIDDDPMFMRAATTGTTAWFATFKGNLRSIDLSGSEARIGPVFALPAQTGGAPEWRPGGVGVIAADAAGRLYALMNPNGREGSHKDGGTEVWMVDPQTRTLIRRIPLPVRAVSIAATREAQSKLAVLGIDRTLYVFDPETGAQLRTVPSVGNSPLSLAVVP